MTDKNKKLKIEEIDRDIQILTHTAAVLEWDQETYMPEMGIEERSMQLSLIQGVIHDKINSPEVKDFFEGASSLKDIESIADLYPDKRDFILQFGRSYLRMSKLPKSLVERIAMQISKTEDAWEKAVNCRQYPLFSSEFKKLLDMIIEKAGYIGSGSDPYDALIDEFEPGMTAEKLKKLLEPLSSDIRSLLSDINEAEQPDDSFLRKFYSAYLQKKVGTKIIEDMGFDSKWERMDISAHPFTATLGSDDIRITTRYDEHYYPSALLSMIHETGHSFYEHGFDDPLKYSILSQASSLGMHEAQSRFFENIIGRNEGFWIRYFPAVKGTFPENLEAVSSYDFFKGVNKVALSPIRTEADELTYSLHIILRFEIENMLVDRSLSVDDLPEAWNEKSRDLMGIVPKDLSEGVLQDVHWAIGSIGYFPAYVLGNIYGAQLLYALEADLGKIDDLIVSGEFKTISGWLKEKVWKYGMRHTSEKIIEMASGEPPSSSYFVGYLRKKYGRIYGLRS